MRFNRIAQRGMTALALAIGCAGIAFAGDSAAEKTTIKLVKGDQVSTFSADDLAVGETRQLIADDGRNIIVSRTENGLDIDDGTDLTQVKLLPPDEALHWISDDGGVEADGAQRIEIRKVIKAGDGEATDGSGKRAMVFISDDGKVTQLDMDGATDGEANAVVVLGDRKIVELKDGSVIEPDSSSRLIVIDRSDSEHKKVMVEVNRSETLHEEK